MGLSVGKFGNRRGKKGYLLLLSVADERKKCAHKKQKISSTSDLRQRNHAKFERTFRKNTFPNQKFYRAF